VHANDEHVFVVGAVEDADHSLPRDGLVDAPEEVVLQLGFGRGLEGRHDAARRIETAHHVADGPVLPSGVHRLEHHEERVPAVGVEKVLQIAEPLEVLVEPFARLFLVAEPRVVARGNALEADLLAGADFDGGFHGVFPPGHIVASR
jgi:hypothetical protein